MKEGKKEERDCEATTTVGTPSWRNLKIPGSFRSLQWFKKSPRSLHFQEADPRLASFLSPRSKQLTKPLLIFCVVLKASFKYYPAFCCHCSEVGIFPLLLFWPCRCSFSEEMGVPWGSRWKSLGGRITVPRVGNLSLACALSPSAGQTVTLPWSWPLGKNFPMKTIRYLKHMICVTLDHRNEL